MNFEKLRGWISTTSRAATARFGSFGEFVFEAVARERFECVEAVHKNEYDFRVGTHKVDVKATAKTLGQSSNTTPCAAYKGRRLPDIRYARVEFFEDGARVSLEATVWRMVPWSELQRLHEEWQAFRASKGRRDIPNASPRTHDAGDEYKSIKARAVDLAQSHGRKARVIHRTCQTRFGYNHPPHNLIWNRRKYDLHIYVSFHDSKRTAANIERIFVIPEEVVDLLPRRPVDPMSQGVSKYDLLRMDPKFAFDSLDEFEEELQRIL